MVVFNSGTEKNHREHCLMAHLHIELSFAPNHWSQKHFLTDMREKVTNKTDKDTLEDLENTHLEFAFNFAQIQQALQKILQYRDAIITKWREGQFRRRRRCASLTPKFPFHL